jgi:flagellum-specific peptidoglycan hydrolase FlgJ
MPTIPYQQSVQQQALPNFRVQPVASDATFGGNIGKALSDIGETANVMAVQDQAKLNQIAVANAQSSAQKSLLTAQTEMLSKQGINALGTAATAKSVAQPPISQDFSLQANGVLKNTLDSLSNDVQKQNFTNWYNQLYPTMYNSVLDHEKKQLTAAHLAANQSQLDAAGETFVSSMLLNNQKQADASLLSGISLSDQMGTINGIPKETLDENHKKFIYGVITNATDEFIASNRPEDAKKMIDWYGNKLPESVKANLMAKINPALTQSDADSYVQTLKNNPDFRNPDNTLNMGAMLNAAENYYRSKTRSITTPGTPGTDEIYNMAQIISQQTGINVNFIYGQIYHESQGGTSRLAKENLNYAGLTQSAPNGEENKQPDGNNYYKTYSSNEEFAKDYTKNFLNLYSGLKEAQTPEEYAAALYDQGYYGDPNKSRQENIDNYVAGMNNGISKIGEGIGGTPATTESVSAPDLVGLKIAQQLIRQSVAESNAEHKQSVDNAMYQFDNWLSQTNPTSVSQIESYAQQLGLQGPDLINAVAKGKQWSGLLKVEENERTAALFEEAVGKIYTGEITSKGQLDTQYGGSLPYTRLATLANSLKRDTGWASPENLQAFNGIMQDKGISGPDKARIYEKMNQLSVESVASGKKLTVEDVIENATDLSQKVIIGSKWGGLKSVNTFKGNIPEGWTTDGTTTYDANGNQVEYNNDTHEWQVKDS